MAQDAQQRDNRHELPTALRCANVLVSMQWPRICTLAGALLAPFAEIVGDIADPQVKAPLCERCCDLPQLVRWNRTMKLLRAIHRSKTGKNLHYVFSPPNRHIPRRRRKL